MSIDTSKGIAGLKGALRYVRAYRDHVFVVKLGGDVLSDPDVRDQVAGQLALLSSLNIRLVVVHGGGPQASALSRRLGQEPTIVAGRRVTDAAALEVAKMVYAGQLNVDLLAALREHKVQAVGLSGIDADLLTAHRRPAVSVVDDDGRTLEVDYGHVGDIDRVDPRILVTLMEERFVPVVASLAGDEDGGVYNVNADTVAESLAVALVAAEAHLPHWGAGRAPRSERSCHARHVRRSRRPRWPDGERRPDRGNAAQGARPAFAPPPAASSAPTSSTAGRRTPFCSRCSPAQVVAR